MQFWRMQLHPNVRGAAARHAIESLAAGFIGLDFKTDPGDLRHVRRADLNAGSRDYWDFANTMANGDKVLVIVHHFPFALAVVDGDYNYITRTEPKIGVWFRHFRRVKNVSYYADQVTDAHRWPRLTMTDTISILKEKTSESYKLIRSW